MRYRRFGWWGKGGIAPLTGRRGSINEALKALTVRPAILAKLKNPRKNSSTSFRSDTNLTHSGRRHLSWSSESRQQALLNRSFQAVVRLFFIWKHQPTY